MGYKIIIFVGVCILYFRVLSSASFRNYEFSSPIRSNIHSKDYACSINARIDQLHTKGGKRILKTCVTT